MPWMLPAAVAGSAVLGAGSSLVGSGKQSSAAKDAANTQKQMYLMNVARGQPFVSAGTEAVGQLPSMLPGVFTEAQLQQMPGYQFALDQGLKSTQSAAAARGLGVSGAALKGAADFAKGLADSTYTNAFNQQQQRYADVMGLATLGANTSQGLGTQGVASAQNQGNALIAAGTAQGSGLMNASNALVGGANSYLGYQMFQDALNRNNPQTQGMYTPATTENPTGYSTGGFYGGQGTIGG